MKSTIIPALLAGGASVITPAAAQPTVRDVAKNITYQGIDRNGIEVFLGIHYGQDTSGANRFKPPVPYVPSPGTVLSAQSFGPACPQDLTSNLSSFPFSVSDVTEISEDCLHLNIARPKTVSSGQYGVGNGTGLPVMVYIHGGGFWNGQNAELVNAPDGLVLQSVENETPIIHVAMNYRLGVFGFAKSNALQCEGSLNAGLRDQRLALEWVRDNIAHFGGNPEQVTIFGQSSGGLAVGMQIMAYGASKPVPFQQAICESQTLEPGITANFTIDAMQTVVNTAGCNSSSLHSAETIACLRSLDTETLYQASVPSYQFDIHYNIGDVWLPAVGDDFLPAAPSQLITEGRFANVTTMMGWCEDDVTYFTDTSISTANDTYDFVSNYIPNLTPAHVDELLSLYPTTDFSANVEAGLSAEFYRSARIFRDIIMTCQPFFYGSHLAARGNDLYFYEWNETILDVPLAADFNVTGMGVIHTSEFAYVFGNLSHYNVTGYAFDPTAQDWALETRASRSWATFAATGNPGAGGNGTFQGFGTAFEGDDVRIFVVGGDDEGLSPIDGPDAHPALAAQKLRERCAFLSLPEVVEEMRY